MSAGPPSFIATSLRVFELSLGQMLWSRRTVFMALVVGGPVVVAVIVRVVASFGVGAMEVNGQVVPGPTIFGLMIWWIYLRFTVPVLAVFYGTALIADEVEDKTITYLFTRPIRRGAVLFGKYLAYLVCTTMVVLPSVVIVYFLVVTAGGGSVAESFPALATDLALLFAGLAVYGAVFALAGAWLRRPLIAGLFFLFGWEPAALAIPGYFKSFTVAYYFRALVPHALPQDGVTSLLQSLFRDTPSLTTSLAALAAIGLGSLFLAMRAVERREYVLEQ